MASGKPAFDNPLFHQEPAHPGVIKLHEDLVAVYQLIRERYQVAIDEAFDRVSRQIGFVIMTTVPISVNVQGQQVTTSLVGENLRETLFERAFLDALGGFEGLSGRVDNGTYALYLIWYEALKLKLHVDWIEPAHVLATHRVEAAQEMTTAAARPTIDRPSLAPGVREPAHWFDRDAALDLNEALVISAIDQVYPELRLVERVKDARSRVGTLAPGTREPAHFRELLERFDATTLDKTIQVIEAVQRLR